MKKLTIANLRAYKADKFCYEVYRLLDDYGTHDTTYIKVIEGGKTILIEDEQWMLSDESEQYPELDGVIKDLKLIGWI